MKVQMSHGLRSMFEKEKRKVKSTLKDALGLGKTKGAATGVEISPFLSFGEEEKKIATDLAERKIDSLGLKPDQSR